MDIQLLVAQLQKQKNARAQKKKQKLEQIMTENCSQVENILREAADSFLKDGYDVTFVLTYMRNSLLLLSHFLFHIHLLNETFSSNNYINIVM